jgi:hypothetical protein
VKLAIGTGRPGVPFSSAGVVDTAALGVGWIAALSALGVSSTSTAEGRASATGDRRSTGRLVCAGDCVAPPRAFGFGFTVATGFAFAAFAIDAGAFTTFALATVGRRFAAARTVPVAMVFPFTWGRAARFAPVFRAAFFTGLRFAAITA